MEIPVSSEDNFLTKSLEIKNLDIKQEVGLVAEDLKANILDLLNH